jgi:glycosyltransferase involved in cell wall biosynthesis
MKNYIRKIKLLFRPRKSTLLSADITVVIPTYNRVSMLDNAITSVLNCGYDNIIIHVFDNFSDDGTNEFMNKLSNINPHVRYFRNDKNIGAIANFQKAFASIKTKYFIPLADDDWLHPGFIAEALDILEKDIDLGATIFVTEARDNRGALLETYPHSLENRRLGKLMPEEHIRDWLAWGHYAWSSILWRSSVLERVGAPFLHAGLPSDVDFQAQVFCHFPVHLVNKVGAGYRIHEEQGGKNLSVSDLLSWAGIFKNLDRLILSRNLIPMNEYLILRKKAQDRYSGLWRRGEPPKDKKVLLEMILSNQKNLPPLQISRNSRIENSRIDRMLSFIFSRRRWMEVFLTR